MTLPTEGLQWGDVYGYNPLGVRKGIITHVLMRDYHGSVTDLRDPLMGLNSFGYMSPYAEDGLYRDDLLSPDFPGGQFYELGGLGETGTEITPDVNVEGVKIAQLSYSYTLDNFAAGTDTSVPANVPWFKDSMWKLKDAAGIIADAKQERANGAQIVLVSMHWGIQFNFTPTPQMVDTATKVLASGEVDTIIGNHAHVVQKCDRINDRNVFYGLGNQISDQGTNWGFPDETQDGIIVKATFKRGADGKWTQPSAEYQVTRVDRTGGYILKLVTPTSNPKSFERESQLIKGHSNACNLSPAPATD